MENEKQIYEKIDHLQFVLSNVSILTAMTFDPETFDPVGTLSNSFTFDKYVNNTNQNILRFCNVCVHFEATSETYAGVFCRRKYLIIFT